MNEPVTADLAAKRFSEVRALGGQAFPEQRLLLVSAEDEESLQGRLRDTFATLGAGQASAADVAYTLAQGRRGFRQRAAVVLPEGEEGAEVFGAAQSSHVATGALKSGPAGLAFLFPGQGSQFVGMGRALYQQSACYRDIFDRCDTLLAPRLRTSLRDLLLVEPAGARPELPTELQQTCIAQPALFVVEYALAVVLREYGVQPELLLGHSIGEYVAACLAGVFELAAALELVAERGRLMQSMPPGSMLAVQVDPEALAEHLGADVDLAAHNAPGLSVVSGTHDAIARFQARIEPLGLQTRALHTSHAFHSRMMDPILEEFGRVVERSGAKPPRIPIISTLTGRLLSDAEATRAEYWARQLRHAVRFAAAARSASDKAERVFVEVGPGVALISSVAKLRDTSARPRKLIETLGHPKADLSAVDALLRGLGQLWIAGAALDFERLYRGAERRLVRLPTYPYHRARHFVDPPKVASPSGSSDLPALTPVARTDADPALPPPATMLPQLMTLLGARLGAELAADDSDRKFLELGFDSLALSQLARKLQQEFGVRVAVAQLFERLGTPRLLAAHLDEQAAARLPTPAAQIAPMPPGLVTAPGTVTTPGHVAPGAAAAVSHAGPETLEQRLARIEQKLEMLVAASAGLSEAPPRAPGSAGVPSRDPEPPPSGRRVRHGHAELTRSQREIWVATAVGGQSANLAYNECRAFYFEGPLNEPALEESLTDLVARHEALRQTFSADGEGSVTHPPGRLALQRHDVRNIEDLAERRLRAQELTQAEVTTPFDLERGPLLRGRLITLSAQECILVLCAHHIAVDGSSWEILIRELSELYTGRVQGRAAALEPAETVAAYSSLERQYHASAQAHQDEAYWLSHLAGQAEDLSLPEDRPRSAQRTYRATRADQQLDAALVARLRKAASAAACTPQTLLLAAFQVLLFRLTRQTDLICGVPTSGQAAVGLEPLVGHFVHVLPVRVRLDPSRAFAAHVGDVQAAMLAALEHQRAAITELLPRLERARDPSRPALIQAAFGMGRSQKRPLFQGLETRVRVVPRVSENFELYVYATEDAGALEVSWSYNTDLFDAATIELWQRCFTTLLEQLADGPPATSLAELPVLSAADRDALLSLARGPVVQRDHVRVEHLIGEVAARSPMALAVIDAAGPHSHAELDARANQIAHFLQARGLAPNALVAVCLDRSAELVAALLGVWRAGCGYIPLDPAYPAARVQMILEDSRAAVILTSRELRGRIPAGDEAICLDEVKAEIASQPTHPPEVTTTPEDTAYVIFTSGSTGRPKGVQISQHALTNFLLSMQREPGLGATDCLLAITTISFDISGLELFLPLVAGARLVLATRDQAINPREIQRLLEEHGVTVLQATPATWQMLFDSGWRGSRGLKVLCGGEAFPRHLAERFIASCGEIWNVYGPTETTVWSTAKRVTNALDLSIGLPIDNTTLYVLDEHQALVPRGVHGELWIGGEGVAKGYLGRPDLTAERFIASPFDGRERLYRTGDLARVRASGDFECLGRVDFQVKIRGFRIELGEVETALIKHPAVQACVVVAAEGRPGEKVLAAYVVLNASAHADAEQLRGALAAELPAYMVPSAYTFLDALPMTPNKKVDRKALPPITQAAPSTRAAARPPEDSVEGKLLAIWADMIGYPSLSIADNYYAVGGHSLLAIRIVERINREFAISLPVNELFNHPTVKAFAEVVRRESPALQAAVSGGLEGIPASADGPVATGPRLGPHRGLFCIQVGTSSDQVPLFLIHGDKANSLVLPELAPGQEVWGYHHQGSDGERVVFRTVESLARHCHDEWVAKHGRRPCLLGGHSFGALVAYHVAVLRERDGLETPRLVIIDARHPSALFGRMAGWGPRGIKRRVNGMLWRQRDRALRKQAESYLDRGEAVPPELRVRYIMGTYRLAAHAYEPPPWQGTLEVIRSNEWVAESPWDGWEQAVRGAIHRTVIEGSHLSLVRSPEGIGRIGAILRRLLLEAQRQG